MIIAAADPGKTGAIVTVNTQTGVGYYHKLKYCSTGLLNTDPVQTLFKHIKPKRIYLEKVRGREGWNATASFSLGAYYGQLRLVIALSGYSNQLVPPKTWQKVIHEGIDAKLPAKEKSLVAYHNMFPHKPIPMGPRGGKAHDGCIDALLILAFAAQKFGVIASDWRLTEWEW